MGGRVNAGSLRLVAPLVGLVACGHGDLAGHYFDVDAKGSENLCTGDGTGYTDSFEYRLELAGNDATLAIGDSVFATGTLDGCSLSYASLAWSDVRDGKEIQWQILGDADVDVSGGEGCVAGSSDWIGTETFVVLASDHPDVKPGCTYTLDMDGSWVRDVGGDEEGTAPATGTTP